jgi:hypothetical protein
MELTPILWGLVLKVASEVPEGWTSRVRAKMARASTGAVTFSWLPSLVAHATQVDILPPEQAITRSSRPFAALCILKRFKQEQGSDIHDLMN